MLLWTLGCMSGIFHWTGIKKNKLVWKQKKSQIAKTTLKKKRAEWITLLDFGLHYKVILIKAVQVHTQKQIHRSITQNRKLRNKPMQYGRSLKKQKYSYYIDSAIPLPGYVPPKLKILNRKYIYIPMFMAALFIT